MEHTLLWSVPPEPKGTQWADDVFTAIKAVSLSEVIEDEPTDDCSSGMFSSDDDADWSTDDGSLDGCSADEDSDSFVSDAYQGERWFWSPPSSMNSIQSYEDKNETASQRSADMNEFGLERSDADYGRPTMYAMPSIDSKKDAIVDAWVDRYGSSKDDFTYVATVSDYDLDDGSQEPTLVTGFYIPQL
ncbi:hypothetical protein KXD40_000836 [Peronospora effusa]|nr:hypothetical protein KXD40_000836 [Peronospora effusa]